MYIGKTIGSVDLRWKQHISDSRNPKRNHRHLYRAMNKYGIDNFKIETIECVNDVDELSEREKYWIDYFGTYQKGYNETRGGDGKSYLDYDKIIALYKQLGSCREVANELHIDYGHVGVILKAHGVEKIRPPRKKKDEQPHLSKEEQLKKVAENNQIPIDMYSLSEEYIQSFPSIKDASIWCIDNHYANGKLASVRVNISKCLNNKIKYSSCHIWKYHNDNQGS